MSSMNEFDKVKVIKAAERVLERIRFERQRIIDEPSGWVSRLFVTKKHIKQSANCFATLQEGIAERAIFKATNCVTSVVYLDNEEINAIRQYWR